MPYMDYYVYIAVHIRHNETKMNDKTKEKKAQIHMSVYKTDRDEFNRLKRKHDLSHRQLFNLMVVSFKQSHETNA